MRTDPSALVWFKRNLRVADHAPLTESTRCDAALALFIIEPAWLSSPECHPRHVAWLLKCLAPLRDGLSKEHARELGQDRTEAARRASDGCEIGNTSRTRCASIVQKAVAYEGRGRRLSQKRAKGSRRGLRR